MRGRTLKSLIAAESNPEGAPAGGISALVYGQTFALPKAHAGGISEVQRRPFSVSFFIIPYFQEIVKKKTCFSAQVVIK